MCMCMCTCVHMCTYIYVSVYQRTLSISVDHQCRFLLLWFKPIHGACCNLAKRTTVFIRISILTRTGIIENSPCLDISTSDHISYVFHIYAITGNHWTPAIAQGLANCLKDLRTSLYAIDFGLAQILTYNSA